MPSLCAPCPCSLARMIPQPARRVKYSFVCLRLFHFFTSVLVVTAHNFKPPHSVSPATMRDEEHPSDRARGRTVAFSRIPIAGSGAGEAGARFASRRGPCRGPHHHVDAHANAFSYNTCTTHEVQPGPAVRTRSHASAPLCLAPHPPPSLCLHQLHPRSGVPSERRGRRQLQRVDP